MKKRTVKTIAVMAVLALAAGVLAIFEAGSGKLRGGRLYRPKNGEKAEYGLIWTAEGETETSGKLDITVGKKKPDAGEMEDIFAYGEAFVRELYPEGTEVAGDLDFPSKVPGTEIKLTWEPEDYTYINTDGTRRKEQPGEEGAPLCIHVTMKAYERRQGFSVNLVLITKERETTFEERLKDYIAETEKEGTEEWITLPDSFEGVDITWEKTKTHDALKLFLLVPLVPAFVFLKDYEDRKKHRKDREKELLDEYPEVVSKFLLLFEAGLTVRAAWGKIVRGVEPEKQENAVYSELSVAYREMENGVSEVTACENFGKRCGLLPYMRFAGLVGQNITKGAASVLPLLEQEAVAAFEERKQAAKRAGEEAGTKLLIPMTGMLIMIMAMIMFAAFQNI